MAVIKSGASNDFLSVDTASKAARVTLYNVDGSVLTSLPVTIVGGVTISNAVEITNDSGSPVPVSGTVAVSGTLPVSNAGLSNLDIATSALRDAIRGASSKTLTDIVTALAGSLAVNVGNFPSSTAISNFPGSQAVTGPITDAQIRASALPVSGPLTDTQIRATALPVSGPVTDTQMRASPVPVLPKSNELAVTAVGAAAAAVTLTLPAAGVGLYHLIDVLEITCYASAAGTGGATPVTVTSTNLSGGLAWTFPSGRAIGVNYNYLLTPSRPIRSSVANTATTIVCPVTTGVIWRVNAIYTTGA